MSTEGQARRDATSATTTATLWMSAVVDVAGCTVEASKPHRERLLKLFHAGEPVWMAADGLRNMLRADRFAKLLGIK